jgi:hypothetical protein
MALEDGKVVLDIFDSLPSLPSFAPLITFIGIAEKGLANFVEIEVAEMEHNGITYDDDRDF